MWPSVYVLTDLRCKAPSPQFPRGGRAPRSLLGYRCYILNEGFDGRLIGAFHHHPDQRLCAARTQVDPPLAGKLGLAGFAKRVFRCSP